MTRPVTTQDVRSGLREQAERQGIRKQAAEAMGQRQGARRVAGGGEPRVRSRPMLHPSVEPDRLEGVVYGVRATRDGLMFVQPVNGESRMAIAGDFNDWQPERTPMHRDEANGVWVARVPVYYGRFRYRLVADGQWRRDPHNIYIECNPFGELNNVVEFGDEA